MYIIMCCVDCVKRSIFNVPTINKTYTYTNYTYRFFPSIFVFNVVVVFFLSEYSKPYCLKCVRVL